MYVLCRSRPPPVEDTIYLSLSLPDCIERCDDDVLSAGLSVKVIILTIFRLDAAYSEFCLFIVCLCKEGCADRHETRRPVTSKKKILRRIVLESLGIQSPITQKRESSPCRMYVGPTKCHVFVLGQTCVEAKTKDSYKTNTK